MEPQRKGAPGTGDDIKKVVELRNHAAVSTAVAYVLEETTTNLELTATTEGQKLLTENLIALMKAINTAEPKEVLARAVDDFMATVKDFDQAATDLVAGAQAQVEEIAAEIAELRQQPPALTRTPMQQVEDELKRRATWQAKVVEIQEQQQDEASGKKLRLQEIQQKLKFGAYESQEDEAALIKAKDVLMQELASYDALVDGIIKAVSENETAMMRLSAYRDAAHLDVSDLIGKPFSCFTFFDQKKGPE